MSQKKEPSQRQLRVAEEIQRVLGQMLLEDNLFIEGLKSSYVMISDVKIAPDMSYASVLVRAIPPVDTDEQVDLLNEHKGKFRYRIGKSVRLRIVPDIVFKSDVRFEETKEMEELLNNPKVRADVDKYKESN